MTSPDGQWEIGNAYDQYVGRWSRKVAQAFLPWLGVPAQADWLDVGCGTGALSAELLAQAAPASLIGLDASPAFVAHARQATADPRARYEPGDAQQLPFERASFDAAVCALVLNFLPDPARAVAEMARVVRPAGVVAAYVWDYADGMQMIHRFWRAAAELNADAARLDEAVRFPLCRAGGLEALWTAAGLETVAERSIDVATVFESFDDFWRPFLGAQGPAPGYVAALDEAAREALRERLRETLPATPVGSIRLSARAWAVRGRVPRAV